ncbi:MAG: class I SAM-dependent methyltransferase [Candidatus Bathyarchaeia archaeon]
MSHSQLLNAYVLGLLPENLRNMFILDVGCGFGEWGFLIRTRKGGFPFLIGVDIWHPHLMRLRKLNVYDVLVRLKIPFLPFKEKSVDASLACEILEHIPKSEGYQLLEELERVSRKLIVVTSPLGWPQEEIYGNPYERHISEWSPRELVQLGSNVKVIDAVALPKTLKLVDKLRRTILRLPYPYLVIAHKRF